MPVVFANNASKLLPLATAVVNANVSKPSPPLIVSVALK